MRRLKDFTKVRVFRLINFLNINAEQFSLNFVGMIGVILKFNGEVSVLELQRVEAVSLVGCGQVLEERRKFL